MKYLYIIRHAKSSWNYDFSDEMRPLALRGRKDVFRVGRELSRTENTPDLMITSHASRALYTALFLADEWGYHEADIQIEEKMYHASTNELLKILSEIDESVNSVAIFGHNPGFTDLANHFNDAYIDNVPTCGVYGFELEVNNWKDIAKAVSERKTVILPKKLRSKH